MSDTWKVVTRQGRVVFDAQEDDARQYLKDHYPRVHVEPGSADVPAPDANLTGPGGESEHWNGVTFVNNNDDDDGDDGDDGDDSPAPSKRAAKKAAPTFGGNK